MKMQAGLKTEKKRKYFHLQVLYDGSVSICAGRLSCSEFEFCGVQPFWFTLPMKSRISRKVSS